MEPGDDHLIVDRVETDESGNLRIFANANIDDIQSQLSMQLSIQQQRKFKESYKKEMESHLEEAEEQEEQMKVDAVEFMREGVDWSKLKEGFQHIIWKKKLYEHLVNFEYDEAINIVDYIKDDFQKQLDMVLFEEDVSMKLIQWSEGSEGCNRDEITGDDEIALGLGDQLNHVNNVIVGQHLKSLKFVLEKCTDVV